MLQVIEPPSVREGETLSPCLEIEPLGLPSGQVRDEGLVVVSGLGAGGRLARKPGQRGHFLHAHFRKAAEAEAGDPLDLMKGLGEGAYATPNSTRRYRPALRVKAWGKGK